MTKANVFEEKFNLFKPKKNSVLSIIKEDYEDIHLTTGTVGLLNNPTGRLTYHIANSGLLLDISEMRLMAKIKIHVAAGKNLTVENNFFPKMFSNISLSNKSGVINSCDYPSIQDDFIKYFSYPKQFYDFKGSINGWLPDNNTGNFVEKLTVAAANNPTVAEMTNILNRLNNPKINQGYQLRQKYFTPKAGAGVAGDNVFHIEYPLRAILSFLDREAYSTVFDLYLHLQKEVDLKNIIFGKADIADAYVTLTIEEMFLRIPKITASTHMQTLVDKQITSSKIAEDMVLDRRTYFSEMRQANFTWNIETGQTYLPQYIYIGIKENIPNSYTVNNSKFVMFKDAANYISSIQVMLNGDKFPLEKMMICDNTGFMNNDSYDETSSTAYKISGGNTFPFDRDEYRNIYPCILMDLTKRNENSNPGSNSVSLKIEKVGAWPVKIYATLFSDKIYHLDFNKNSILVE